MKTESRHQSEILRIAQLKGSCTIIELANQLGVSDETVRRHVKPLVEKGSVYKVHGGIVLPDRLHEAPMERRMDQNRDAKIGIAAAVADLIEDGDSLILDTGSTTAYVARALSGRNHLKVITNSLQIARTLSRDSTNQIYMIGGDLDADVLATFGPSALDFLKQFHVRHGILSIGGINESNQLMNFELREAEFSRTVIQQSASVTVVADHTKFSRRALVTVGNVADIDCFVSDQQPPEHFLEELVRHDVNLITT